MDSPLSVVSYDHNVAILVAPPAIMTIYRDTTIRLNGTKSKSLVLLCNVKPKSESLIIAYCHDRKNKYMRARKYSFLHFSGKLDRTESWIPESWLKIQKNIQEPKKPKAWYFCKTICYMIFGCLNQVNFIRPILDELK